MKVAYKKIQDDEGEWYWIPKSLLKDFDADLSAIVGKDYMDCPDDFDNFINKYEGYRCGGSPDNVPLYFVK